MRAWFILIVLLLLATAAGLMFGPSGFISPAKALTDAEAWRFVLHFRAPHVVLALVVGSALAVSGGTLQGLLRNPLAEPYILGVSGGAAMGAIFHTLYPVGGVYGRSLCAFVGAVGTAWLVFRIAAGSRRRMDNSILILAGVMLNVFFSASIVLFLTLADRAQSHELFFWLMGTLKSWSLEEILPFVPLVIVLIVIQAMLGFRLNVLSQGDEHARLLGVDPYKNRMLLLALVAMTIGAVVSLGGIIGFVGLVVPHALRLVVGGDNRRLLPLSALAGAVFLLVCDGISRTVYAPVELPIGAVTSFFGVPFFLWLLTRTRHGGLEM